MKRTILCLIVASLLFSQHPSFVSTVYAQSEVTCGDIIEGEFVENAQEHLYELSMAPGESFDVQIEPIGDFLRLSLAIYGPSGLRIHTFNDGKVDSLPEIASDVLSARGKYVIQVANTWVRERDLASRETVDHSAYLGGVGVYLLSITCTKRDGEVIAPGDSLRPTPIPTPLPTPTVRPGFVREETPIFGGIGFPGIAPVDFSNVARIPLIPDTTITGVVPTGNEILGFTVDAEENDILTLDYRRLSGNMNLGIILISENNQVYFQASLVTSDSLSSTIVLPESGNYTIGVFRVSLVEPSEPEGIVFQLTGTLEPAPK